VIDGLSRYVYGEARCQRADAIEEAAGSDHSACEVEHRSISREQEVM
jgi:hypothetical protein